MVDRCKVVGGDMFAGVPESGEFYVLSRVVDSREAGRLMHNHDAGVSRQAIGRSVAEGRAEGCVNLDKELRQLVPLRKPL